MPHFFRELVFPFSFLEINNSELRLIAMARPIEYCRTIFRSVSKEISVLFIVYYYLNRFNIVLNCDASGDAFLYVKQNKQHFWIAKNK